VRGSDQPFWIQKSFANLNPIKKAVPKNLFLCLKNQFPILRADFDFIARLEFARQQLRRERVVFLNRALEWARAELR
jgi:hypothetical protein